MFFLHGLKERRRRTAPVKGRGFLTSAAGKKENAGCVPRRTEPTFFVLTGPTKNGLRTSKAPAHIRKADEFPREIRRLLVPVAGVEPARCRHHGILSPARLPIPSHRPVRHRLLYRICFSNSRIIFGFFTFSRERTPFPAKRGLPKKSFLWYHKVDQL